jgi:hypothetical protein
MWPPFGSPASDHAVAPAVHPLEYGIDRLERSRHLEARLHRTLTISMRPWRLQQAHAASAGGERPALDVDARQRGGKACTAPHRSNFHIALHAASVWILPRASCSVACEENTLLHVRVDDDAMGPSRNGNRRTGKPAETQAGQAVLAERFAGRVNPRVLEKRKEVVARELADTDSAAAARRRYLAAVVEKALVQELEADSGARAA